MLSICRTVRLSVRLCVCSLLRYRLTVILPPLPEVGCPIFLEIRNPWGKIMERSGLTFAFYKSKCPSVCVSFCLFVFPFTFEVPFNGLFAPFSQSRMSNIFRDSESLGKSNGKKWSHIWTFLFENCQKLPRLLIYFFFFADFAGLFQWGGYITTWGGYIEIWGGYIGMMRVYWDWFWTIFSVFQKNRVLGYSWSTLLWHRCYYPHRSRDSVSPVCGIFYCGLHNCDSV